MTIEIYEIADIEDWESYLSDIKPWSELWWDDFDEAGIKHCYIAFDGDDAVGFQTVNDDNATVAIEVAPTHRGQGIATALINESGSYKPEFNGEPAFWEHIAHSFLDA